jgi:hypothetical protein
MVWLGRVSLNDWGELIRESLKWGRQTQKDILKDAKTMSYKEYARKWRAKFWKGRKVIYRAAKEGPTERVTMNKIRSERTGLVVTKPGEVREEVFKGFSTELPYRMSVPMDKLEGSDPLAEGPGLGRHYTGPGRGLGHRFVSDLFYDVLHYLPEDKAAGPDGVPNDIIKRMPKEFHDLLFRIMKKAWEGHHTPEGWKGSTVALLHKKGDSTKLRNWRPIALANCTYKLYTAVVTRLMTDDAEYRSVLNSSQEGFRRGRNTHGQLEQMILAVEDAQLSQQPLHVLYLDFENAFGSPDHDRLLEVLKYQGFAEDALAVIRDLYPRRG